MRGVSLPKISETVQNIHHYFMNHKPELVKSFSQDSKFYPIYLVHFLMAGIFTLFFINLVGSRWAFYDIGINATTQGWTLILFIAPIMFIVLNGAVAISWYVLRHQSSGKRLFLTGIGSMMIIFVIAFWLDMWRTVDYPNPFNRNLLEFFHYYVTQWLNLLNV